MGSFVSVAVCRLNGSCLLIAPSDCEPSCKCYSDVRRVATEPGVDGASGCHAKHSRSLRLEFCDCVKEMSNDRKNPIGYSEVMSLKFRSFPYRAALLCGQISKLSTLPSYGLRCYTAPVYSLLKDRSENPQPSHLGQQRGSFQSEFRRCAARSTYDPPGLLQRFHNESAIRVFQGHR